MFNLEFRWWGLIYSNNEAKTVSCDINGVRIINIRFSGDGSAPPRFLVAVNFAWRRLAFASRRICSVTSPLPKKFCDTFWEPYFPVLFFSGVCLAAARRSRAALVFVFAKHTPRCQS